MQKSYNESDMSNILTTLVRRGAERYGNRAAFSFKSAADTEWTDTSWTDFNRRVVEAGEAFAAMGEEPGAAVGVFSHNRPEILVTDFGAFANRMVTVSIYATSSPEQVAYIVNDAHVKTLFVGDDEQYQTVMKVIDTMPGLEHIVVYDSRSDFSADNGRTMTFEEFIGIGRNHPEVASMVAERTASAKPADTATLLYTSGTTGEPKGAILLHSCFDSALEQHRQALTMLSDADTSVCFLPLSHIFEKAWTYFCLMMGMKVYINLDPRDVQTTIRTVKPTCMCSVPRFWEKVYTAVNAKVSRMNPVQRALVKRALKVGRRRNLDYKRLGLKVPALLELQYNFFEKRVFGPMKRVIGIEHGNIFPTAGAPLSAGIIEFLHSCGINIVIGYGLSETTATVSFFPQIGFRIGTVGTCLPDVRVKIGEENEILVKGPTVMAGYYGKSEATAQAFTGEGWFRTGDAGYIDDTGAIVLTERIKDLFKTSNGKYIAPQAIESRLGEDEYIEQVAVIGDCRKYVTALIIPAYDMLKDYARRKGITYSSIAELVENSDIHRFIEERIERLQKGLASYEKVKRFILLPKEFTMEAGELTNTLKLRRPVINSRYADRIEAMYAQ